MNTLNFQQKLLQQSVNTNKNLFKGIPKRGYNMTKLHFYGGAGHATPSGIKVSILGATSRMAYKIAGHFFQAGTPMILCHRGPLDNFLPIGDDPQFTRSNPYYTFTSFFEKFDTVNYVNKF
jgi:hypothetical protein